MHLSGLERTPGRKSRHQQPEQKSQESGQVQSDGKPATVEKMLPGGKLLTDAPKITYTTKAGKKLDGVIAKTLTMGQAMSIDPSRGRRTAGSSSASNMSSGRSRITKRATTSPRGSGHPCRPCRLRHGPEGKSAAEILEFIGKASRRTFNRYLANALKNLGASSTITLDSQGGWRFGNTSRAQKYAAAYNSRTDTVALSTAREAERHILHELVHAATMKAIIPAGRRPCGCGRCSSMCRSLAR